jgi:ankyrin repeat protein
MTYNLRKYASVTVRSLVLLALVMLVIGCTRAVSGMISSAKTGDVNGLEMGLKEGVPINKQYGNFQLTALMHASYSGQAEAVEFLCKKGADLNIRDLRGATALIYAAYYDHVDVVEILLKYNADKTIKDKYGNTAYDYAKEYKYTRLIRILQE